MKNIAGKTGFLTLKISANEESEVQFKLRGEGVNDIIYQFKIKQGTHLYRFRTSSDILWYSGKITNLEIENFSVNEIYFEVVN